MRQFGLEEVFKVAQEAGAEESICHLEVADLLTQYPTLFDRARAPAVMNVPPVDLPLKENAQPKYCKSRPVPFALQDKLKSQLQKMQDTGVVEPVSFSRWASPVKFAYAETTRLE